MKVLFVGDSAGTGFGSVTRDLGSGLLALGEDVRFVSLNEQPVELDEPFKGRTATVGGPNGWLAIPTAEDPDERKAEAERLTKRLEGMFTGGIFEDGWTPEVGLVLGDPASVRLSPVMGFIPDGFPVFHYVPIEGVGSPPAWRALWQKMTPVACSEFGATEIERLTGRRPAMVYHGIGAEFWPVSAARPIRLATPQGIKTLRSKEECKRFFGGRPDETWLLRTDRLVPRKMYASLLRSLAPVLERHPGVRFWWHCRTLDEGGDLREHVSHFGKLALRMRPTGFHDQNIGLTREWLNALYNAADVYVSSSAEGFGLTIGEALACGVPAVVLDYAAAPEVVGPAGRKVPVGAMVDNIYAYFWARPDERAYTGAVEELVSNVALRRYLGALGPSHVRRNFYWPVLARSFRDLMAAALRQEVAA